MSPEEIIQSLKNRGVSITRKTLLNYEKLFTLSEPKRGSEGRGKGRFTVYSDDVLEDAFVIYHMLNTKRTPIWQLNNMLKLTPYFLREPKKFYDLLRLEIPSNDSFAPVEECFVSTMRSAFFNHILLIITYRIMFRESIPITTNLHVNIVIRKQSKNQELIFCKHCLSDSIIEEHMHVNNIFYEEVDIEQPTGKIQFRMYDCFSQELFEINHSTI
ncbi:hypothetical protein SPSIL_019980 [Sporomusa silvacetica DSM 10669]|uniref:HTH merR-type domain-containing protein n=1 Tax=Sporomusa silvacetica DSM 10669 TaxID=1123289 RepID=A0ABZ3IJM3_9FIRM|nr:hypothetical protein [Sporomusa silvacetica]OZC18749.1 hypothetical protein SPSIL_23580 [Sporomusa silvacetica DSM 10669]